MTEILRILGAISAAVHAAREAASTALRQRVRTPVAVDAGHAVFANDLGARWPPPAAAWRTPWRLGV
jgi:hypothetical protein